MVTDTHEEPTMNQKPLRLSLASLLLTPFAFGRSPDADGWLGVYLANDRDEAVVVEVIPDSPAARAGLRAGDVLLAVDGQATPTRDALIAAVRGHAPGATLTVKLRRDGAEQTVRVELGQRPDAVPTPAPEGGGSDGGAQQAPRRVAPPAPGGEGRPLTPAPTTGAQKGYLGLRLRETDAGVAVEAALEDGPAAAVGIRSGERITRFGGRPVQTLADLDAVLRQHAPGSELPLELRSAAGVRSVTLRLGAAPGSAPAEASAPRETAPGATAPDYDVQREIAELRRDLQELRRQLEELRRQRGRE